MVERYDASPFTRFQAEVYRKILALADECDSVETMTVRLQNEGYNAMPATALIKDKITAHYQAAVDSGLDEHATIYKKALDNIIANPDEAYLTGFYDDIKQANIRYAKTLEKLLACFDDFVHYDMRKEVLDNVMLRYDDWKKEDKSFAEVLQLKVFRNHFSCSDAYLARFITEYNDLIKMATAGKQPELDIEKELEQAWNVIKNKEAERHATAKNEIPRYRSAAVMSIAPATAAGDYEYINEEFEAN